MSGDSTTILTNIHEVLGASESEASDRPASLIVLGGELNGNIFDLIEAEVTAGRDPNNAIPLDFHGISRFHFKIFSSEGGGEHRVVDAGSKNGTYLNNQKIEEEQLLNKGDTIKIGPIALKYLPKGDPERLTYDKLQHEATTDGLTGCYNKSYFNNHIELEVKRSKLSGRPLSLLVFDLDHFKKLNDTYGHDAGDFVLREVSALIRDNGVRDKDIFARYGGEEFVVLLPETTLKQSFEVAERLRQSIEQYQFVYENQTLQVSASVGVADYRQGVVNGTDLFKRADEAVYKSKEGGRNQTNFYRAE